MRHAAMKVAAHLLNAVDGAPISWLYRGQGHILMFHRVHPPRTDQGRVFANSYLEVTPEFLQSTIDYFRRRGYAFLAIDEIGPHLRDDRSGRPFVAYTFDDGFRDNLEFGLPVFQRNKVPFSVNVTTGFPDRTAMLWWNELEALVLSGETLSIEIEGEKRVFSTRNQTERTSAFKVISRWLKYSKNASLEERIGQMLHPFGIDPLDQVRGLAASWDELRSAALDPLLTIGAHTVTHPVLAELTEDAAFIEMLESRRRLEEELGRSIEHFAYPYGGRGEIGPREVELARRAGFQTAVTTYSSNVHSAHIDQLFCLPRIAVGPSMTERTFDLIRHGVIPMVRNRGRRVASIA